MGELREGVVFVPFHYGYWDESGEHEPNGRPRAANELTITQWDPASKQPLFKTAAARIDVLERADGHPSPAPTTTASYPVTDDVPPTVGSDAATAEEVTA